LKPNSTAGNRAIDVRLTETKQYRTFKQGLKDGYHHSDSENKENILIESKSPLKVSQTLEEAMLTKTFHTNGNTDVNLNEFRRKD
jgi:hypothetical protein